MTNHPNRSKIRTAASNPTPEQIRDARKSAGLRQAAAAAVIYSTERSWQAWEGGHRLMHPQLYEAFVIKTRRQRERLARDNPPAICATDSM